MFNNTGYYKMECLQTRISESHLSAANFFDIGEKENILHKLFGKILSVQPQPPYSKKLNMKNSKYSLRTNTKYMRCVRTGKKRSSLKIW